MTPPVYEGRAPDYQTLYEISVLLHAEPDVEHLIRLAIDKVIETTGAQRGLIVVCDDRGGLHFECARDRRKVNMARPTSEVSQTFIRAVLDADEPMLLDNALSDPLLDTSQSTRRLNLTSLAGTPLRVRDQTFGALYIEHRGIKALFDDHTRLLLGELARLIAAPLKRALERRRLLDERARLRAELDQERGYGKLIGISPAMQRLFEQIDRIADTEVSVLITGETGVGKELVARELHQRSARRDRELVTLNCSAIPEYLLESELFGHVKGAFTGADRDNPGWFETADGSTLFLDEVSELSPGAQAKLLRALQFGETTRVGARTTKTVDVRVLAATNQDLRDMVHQGRFREDLLFRLNVVELHVPPLRERARDVLQIARYVLDRFATRANKPILEFSEASEQRLLAYTYPGNVRELENIVQRAVYFCTSDRIEVDDLPPHMARGGSGAGNEVGAGDFKTAKAQVVAGFERAFLAARLRETGGNISEAARQAGMHKKNFIAKMKRYGLQRATFME